MLQFMNFIQPTQTHTHTQHMMSSTAMQITIFFKTKIQNWQTTH